MKKNYILYLGLVLLPGNKIEKSYSIIDDCGESVEDRSFVEEINMCDYLGGDEKKVCIKILDNKLDNIIHGEYKEGIGFLPISQDEAKYLAFAYLNLALLKFQTAKDIVLQGYQRGKISKEQFEETNKIIESQNRLYPIIINIEEEIAKEEKERIEGGYSKILIPLDLERRVSELIGQPFKGISLGDTNNADYYNLLLYSLLTESYQIEVNYPNARLERAKTISFNFPMLLELAIQDTEFFVLEQNDVPSHYLADAYHLQAQIWTKQKESKKALAALERERKIRQQGFKGLIMSGETELFKNLVDTAKLYSLEGDVSLAAAFLEQASREAVNPNTHTYLAYEFGLLGEYEIALREIEQNLMVDPNYGLAYLQKGYIIRQSNPRGTKEEGDCFQRALKLGLESQDIELQMFSHGGLCKYYSKKGEQERALYHKTKHRRLREERQKQAMQ